MKSKLSRLDSASLSNGHGSVLARAGGDLQKGQRIDIVLRGLGMTPLRPWPTSSKRLLFSTLPASGHAFLSSEI